MLSSVHERTSPLRLTVEHADFSHETVFIALRSSMCFRFSSRTLNTFKISKCEMVPSEICSKWHVTICKMKKTDIGVRIVDLIGERLRLRLSLFNSASIQCRTKNPEFGGTSRKEVSCSHPPNFLTLSGNAVRNLLGNTRITFGAAH